ncbi:hypothetical protein FRC17_008099 [Serendipita sp. 399]|nr:hypothetical protein FRC17_008099 [Serendipita sp. 399]
MGAGMAPAHAVAKLASTVQRDNHRGGEPGALLSPVLLAFRFYTLNMIFARLLIFVLPTLLSLAAPIPVPNEVTLHLQARSTSPLGPSSFQSLQKRNGRSRSSSSSSSSHVSSSGSTSGSSHYSTPPTSADEGEEGHHNHIVNNPNNVHHAAIHQALLQAGIPQGPQHQHQQQPNHPPASPASSAGGSSTHSNASH